MSKIELSLPCPVARAFTGHILSIVDERTKVAVHQITQTEPDALPYITGNSPDLTGTHWLSIIQNREQLYETQ